MLTAPVSAILATFAALRVYGTVKMSDRGRYLTVAVGLLVSGCTDLTAVQQFSKTAPDQTKLDALSDTYVSDPALFNGWRMLRSAPDSNVASLQFTRAQQKTSIDQVNSLIVNYMTALGNLSNAGLTDVSAEAKSVSSGLTKLNAADPKLGLDPTKISSIGNLLTIVSQDALNFWRAEKLQTLLADNQVPFHALLDTEITITERYSSDFSNTSGEVQSDKGFVDSQASGQLYSRMARLSTDRLAESDMKMLSASKVASDSYVQALTKLGAAYDKLVGAKGDFSAATYKLIQSDLGDVESAYKDLAKL